MDEQLERGLGLPDRPVEQESEDIFQVGDYVDGLTRFIQHCNTPMTVAIQGDWGSGKTSIMQLIRRQLGDGIIPVWFNTWQFSQFDLGDQLPILLLDQLLDKLTAERASEAGESGKHILSGLKTCISEKKGAILMAAMEIATKGDKLDALDSLLEKYKKASDPVKTVDRLHEKIQTCIDEAVDQLPEGGRVVVFIDDLDRLRPEKAVEVLEVLKLFVDCRNCVFVLAVDYSVVIQGIRQKYGDQLGEEKGRNFFDKMIQVPFKMPVAQYDIQNYVKKTLEDMDLEDCSTADFSELIRDSIGYNPRSMKRLFNAFQLLILINDRKLVHEAHSRTVLFAVLCMQLAYEPVYNFMAEHSGELVSGFFDSLRQLEELDGGEVEPHELAAELAGSWTDSRNPSAQSFLRSFCRVLETEGDYDLPLLKKMLTYTEATSTERRTSASSGGMEYQEKTWYSLNEPLCGYHQREFSLTGAKLYAYRFLDREETALQNWNLLLERAIQKLAYTYPDRFLLARDQVVKGENSHRALRRVFCGENFESQNAFLVKRTISTVQGDIPISTGIGNGPKLSAIRELMTAMGLEEELGKSGILVSLARPGQRES